MQSSCFYQLSIDKHIACHSVSNLSSHFVDIVWRKSISEYQLFELAFRNDTRVRMLVYVFQYMNRILQDYFGIFDDVDTAVVVIVLQWSIQMS